MSRRRLHIPMPEGFGDRVVTGAKAARTIWAHVRLSFTMLPHLNTRWLRVVLKQPRRH